MRHSRRLVRSTAAAAILLLGGVGVLIFPAVASAAPSITVTPDTNLTAGETVTVTASGYTGSEGAIEECNTDPAQPNGTVAGNSVPLSCTDPLTTTGALQVGYKNGGFTATFKIVVGTTGPSDGSTAGASAYPCPPTAAELAENPPVTCVIAFGDQSSANPPVDEEATQAITFASTSGTTTTTSTTAPTGGTTTTTTAPANKVTLTVSPATGLINGSVVTVSGSGYADNSTGAILECNNDPAQPTIVVEGSAAPVSCTNPLKKIETTSASGALGPVSYTVAAGTVGPPTTGTDSSGGDAATDAAAYPCPPTAAQITAGYSCTIAFGDLANDEGTANISFGSIISTAGSGTSAATTAKTVAATTGTSGTLAFTGPGPGVWVMGIGGLMLLDIGFLVMTLFYRPRELLMVAGKRIVWVFGSDKT